MSKQYCSRVLIEIMADIYTESDDDQQAGTMSEDIGEDLVRYLEHQIIYADGCPDVDEVQITSYAAKNLDVEEMEEDE